MRVHTSPLSVETGESHNKGLVETQMPFAPNAFCHKGLCFCSLLISYIESGDPFLWKGIFISIAMLLNSFLNSILINNFLFFVFRAGARARTVVNAAVYRKVRVKTQVKTL